MRSLLSDHTASIVVLCTGLYMLSRYNDCYGPLSVNHNRSFVETVGLIERVLASRLPSTRLMLK